MKLRNLFEASAKSVGIIFGRFNPPHKGHRKAWEMASENDAWFVGTNQSTQGPKDPLPYDVKIETMKMIYPEVEGHIMPEQSWLTMASRIFKKYGDIILKIYTDEEWVVKTIIQYNGKEGPHGFYNFKTIDPVGTPRLSSATALRNAVAADDRAAFSQAAGIDADTPLGNNSFFDVVKHYLTQQAKPVKKEKAMKVKEYKGATDQERIDAFKKQARDMRDKGFVRAADDTEKVAKNIYKKPQEKVKAKADEGRFGRDRDPFYGGDEFRNRERNVGVENERNNYQVTINGKLWKVFADRQQAINIARSLRMKGKDVEVYPTGAPPSESISEATKKPNATTRHLRDNPVSDKDMAKPVKPEKKKDEKKAVAEGSLNELDTDTLKSYREKAGKEVKDLDRKKQELGQLSDKDFFKKQDRLMGITGASKRIDKRGITGVAESPEDNRQWSNKDNEQFRRAVKDIEDNFGPNDAWTKTKQRQIKQRIKTEPMSGPKGKLPEQGVAETGMQKNIKVGESGLQYHTGVKKHGEKYMRLAADAARKGASQQELGRLRDKHSKAYKKEDVSEGSSYQTDSMVSHISQIIKDIYPQGGDKNTYMKLVARKMPNIVKADPKLFRRAFGMAYDRFFHISQDDDYDYTDYSMRQGERGMEESKQPKVSQKPRQGPLRPQTGAGKHQDKKKAEKQGKEKHKKPLAEAIIDSMLSELDKPSGKLYIVLKADMTGAVRMFGAFANSPEEVEFIAQRRGTKDKTGAKMKGLKVDLMFMDAADAMMDLKQIFKDLDFVGAEAAEFVFKKNILKNDEVDPRVKEEVRDFYEYVESGDDPRMTLYKSVEVGTEPDVVSKGVDHFVIGPDGKRRRVSIPGKPSSQMGGHAVEQPESYKYVLKKPELANALRSLGFKFDDNKIIMSKDKRNMLIDKLNQKGIPWDSVFGSKEVFEEII